MYFYLETVLYYSVFNVRHVPLRWSFLAKVLKLVRNVSFLGALVVRYVSYWLYTENGSL